MTWSLSRCTILTVSKSRKTTSYQYKLHSKVLQQVTHAKYLRATIQSDRKWDRHIHNIVSKANETLGFLRRNLKMSAVQTKELAYKSLVRPLLE